MNHLFAQPRIVARSDEATGVGALKELIAVMEGNGRMVGKRAGPGHSRAGNRFSASASKSGWPSVEASMEAHPFYGILRLPRVCGRRGRARQLSSRIVPKCWDSRWPKPWKHALGAGTPRRSATTRDSRGRAMTAPRATNYRRPSSTLSILQSCIHI